MCVCVAHILIVQLTQTVMPTIHYSTVLSLSNTIFKKSGDKAGQASSFWHKLWEEAGYPFSGVLATIKRQKRRNHTNQIPLTTEQFASPALAKPLSSFSSVRHMRGQGRTGFPGGMPLVALSLSRCLKRERVTRTLTTHTHTHTFDCMNPCSWSTVASITPSQELAARLVWLPQRHVGHHVLL